MRPIRNLIEASGLGVRRMEVLIAAAGSSVIMGSLVYLLAGISGLALCSAVLTLVVWLEALRSLAQARQKRLDQVWPAVFDALRSGAQAGLGLIEQFQYLSTEGPEQLRTDFAELRLDIERGIETEEALSRFQERIGSRGGDFLAIVTVLVEEIGGRGEVSSWDQAATQLRQEQAIISQVKAKQGWVLASAKIALLAPWLICAALLTLEQNRVAFASYQGSMILLVGLALSLFAYFLTNLLGRLDLPGRVFHVG